MAFVKAVRRGITKVTRLPGGTVDAIVLSPEMDEAIDLSRTRTTAFWAAFQLRPSDLVGRPRDLGAPGRHDRGVG